jgi:adenylate cyclase
MAGADVTRRLAAVLAADVVGYSKMMGVDEAGTLAALRDIWSEHFNPAIAEHNGRIAKMMGDGALAEFASVVDAVSCAIAFQRRMAERNDDADHVIEFRIGVNLGDIVIEDGDIFGDGVNIAARLEG